MKVIIDIDECVYKRALKNKGTDASLNDMDKLRLEVAIEGGTPFEEYCKDKVVEELEKIYEEAGAVELTTPKISKGFECYGFIDKTAEEIKAEILDILNEHLEEADTPKRREGTPLEENDSGYNCENWIP